MSGSGSGSSPEYTAEDFLTGYQGLLPTGPIWPRDPDAVQTQVFLALSQGYARNATSALGLLSDAFPVAPVMMLPEWQETLGLPDPCVGPNPPLALAQQQVNARFIASGGQTIAYYTRIAAALGFTITITQYAPFTVGQPVGRPLYGEAWAYAWMVSASESGLYGNNVLSCEIQRIAPAHTVVQFVFSPENAIGMWSNGGVLTLYPNTATGWPTSPDGLAAGALWNNGLSMAVVPGAVRSLTAAAIVLGDMTSTEFLATGGGNLPLASPSVGSSELWNNGGLVCVA
jgi:uncharacterized protein YmfQ (DUF2313 family)